MPSMDNNNPERIRENTTNSLNSRHALYTRCIRLLYTAATLWQRAWHHIRTTMQWFQRRSVYVFKTFGVLVAITFGTASLIYTKQGADYARCQLKIAQRQYCETADLSTAKSETCEEILARPVRMVMCDRYLIWNCRCYPKPRIWRFPGIYDIAELLRSTSGTSIVCAGITIAGLLALQRNRQSSQWIMMSLIGIQSALLCVAWWLFMDDMKRRRSIGKDIHCIDIEDIKKEQHCSALQRDLRCFQSQHVGI